MQDNITNIKLPIFNTLQVSNVLKRKYNKYPYFSYDPHGLIQMEPIKYRFPTEEEQTIYSLIQTEPNNYRFFSEENQTAYSLIQNELRNYRFLSEDELPPAYNCSILFEMYDYDCANPFPQLEENKNKNKTKNK